MVNSIEEWSSLGVPSIITKALHEQHFYSPTMIQTLTIPPAIFDHRDILGAAETGSGKTLAFGLPILNGILELKKRNETYTTECKEISTDGITCCESNAVVNNNQFQKEPKLNYLTKKSFDLKKCCINVGLRFESITLKPLYAVILTPTRELACQIKNHLSVAAKFTDIKVSVLNK
jgi:ATP-dependent RNA helicase DDX24/MAK5